MMRVISKHLGLDIKFKVSREPLNWGYLQQNGSASGIFQDLLHSEIDLGFSLTSFSFQKILKKLYLQLYLHSHICLGSST